MPRKSDFTDEQLVALRLRGEVPVCTRCRFLVHIVRPTGKLRSYCRYQREFKTNTGTQGYEELNLVPCPDFEPDDRKSHEKFISGGY